MATSDGHWAVPAVLRRHRLLGGRQGDAFADQAACNQDVAAQVVSKASLVITLNGNMFHSAVYAAAALDSA